MAASRASPRLAWAQARIDAHLHACADCGAEPTVVPGQSGPRFQCVRHPEATVVRRED